MGPAPVSVERQRIDPDGLDRLSAHLPAEDAAVERETLRFTWADRGTESYRIAVTAEDGRLIWSAAVTDTTVAPPDSIVLEPGNRFFWYVDAISAGVVARTQVQSFRVAP